MGKRMMMAQTIWLRERAKWALPAVTESEPWNYQQKLEELEAMTDQELLAIAKGIA
jgi:hypothetical protein